VTLAGPSTAWIWRSNTARRGSAGMASASLLSIAHDPTHLLCQIRVPFS
jgi:hypothetical protein